MYIDETEINESKILALSIAEMDGKENLSNLNATMIELHRYLTDPLSGGNKDKIKKNGLHYCDANEDLRKQYVDKMAIFSFKGYIAFIKLENAIREEYEDKYLLLLKRLVTDRFITCDGAIVKIIFEENSKISSKKIRQVVINCYDDLRLASNRRPILSPEIIIGKKLEYPCFSIPDFLLGVFRKYWSPDEKEKKEKSERRQLHFERLSDKYKIILDAEKNIVYSRKRPISPLK